MLKESDDRYKTLVGYLDGSLDFKEKKSFEDKLSKSPGLLNYLLELKKDRLILERAPFRQTPDYLLKQALSMSKQKSEKTQTFWGEIILRLKDRSLELIRNSFTPSPPLKELVSYRDNSFNTEKYIFSQRDFELSVLPINGEKINISLSFGVSQTMPTHVELYRKTDSGLRMIASLQPTARSIEFKELMLSSYIIKIMGNDLAIEVLA